MWSTGEGNGKPLQYSCLENTMNSMKRENDRTPKEELPRSLGAQYATGDQRRNNYRKNEGMERKQKQYPVVDVTDDRSKIQCCKEQYCIGTWNVRSIPFLPFIEPIFAWNGKPLQYFCLENPMNSMKRQKGRTLKDELPRSVGAQYATGDH